MTPDELDQQITDARREIAAMKAASPWMFPQWDALKTAIANKAYADEQLRIAQAAWDKLGT